MSVKSKYRGESVEITSNAQVWTICGDPATFFFAETIDDFNLWTVIDGTATSTLPIHHGL